MIRRYLVAILVALAILPSAAPAAHAHELLPPELVTYMEAHPDATPEEIETFLESNPQLYDGEEAKSGILDTLATGEVGFWHNALAFTKLGIEHILIGLDHVLFVLALLLTFVSLRATLKSITAFTVAHSVTLILAGTGALTLSARVVEPIIALSIAFVAIGTVFLGHLRFFSSLKSTIAVIFAFGLFHGLGFAGLLENFSIPQGRFISSLLFFNVGIELGQLIIIAILLPFIYALRGRRWYPRAVQVVAVGISALAIVWFVERAFDLSIITS